jgi:hypothetical protein
MKKVVTRRRALAIVGGALILAGSGVAVVRTRGYDVPAERVARLRALSPWHFVVVQALARRIAAPDVEDGSVPSTDDVDVAGFIDGFVANMASPLRRDLLRLLGFVEHVAPLMTKQAARFSKLGAAAQDRVLSSLEASDHDLLRGAFAALKSLVFMGYYRDARTWKIIGYAGPFVAKAG